MSYRVAKPTEMKLSEFESTVSATSARAPSIKRSKTGYFTNANKQGLKRRISKLMLQQDQENRPHRNEFVDLPTQSSADQEEDMME